MAPIGTFEVHDIFFNNEDDFYFIVNFSDPILTTQDLAGLITIQDYDQLITYAVQGNNIKVFPATRITGNQTVNAYCCSSSSVRCFVFINHLFYK